MQADVVSAFPRALSDYPSVAGETLLQQLAARVDIEPFNAVATAIFALAILHTFAAGRFSALAHRVQQRRTSPFSEALYFLGEVEVVFGLWAVVLAIAMTMYGGWSTVTHYINDTVDYREALFVVVIMALASTRPIVNLAEAALGRAANAGGGTPAAWWLAILTVGPVLGSLITEPGAMTLSAVLLARQFFDLRPGPRLKYATIGLLFVNISIGGTLTHFAAPPVLMVARAWSWDTPFMLTHFGWRTALAIAISNAFYLFVFRRELRALAFKPPVSASSVVVPVPRWVTAVHVAFIAWTVFNAHYPALFLGGFMFFLGFARATAAHQSRLELRTPLLVGFFLGGLVIHGGLQGWWIGPVLGRLSETPLFVGSALLTAFNDNALITYLATLVPNLDQSMRIAVVEGAVVGGGMTVIANAPNPAGYALLNRFFKDDAISPVGLALGALPATLIAAAIFRLV